MTGTPSTARPTIRRIRWLFAIGLVVVIARIPTALGYQLPDPWSSTTSRSEHHEGLDETDGIVPDGTTVFADDLPAVANLDPALLKSLRRAATEAANDKVGFYVNSGWRSPAYQNQLLREAITMYGSEAEAARWVATPAKSPHVSGEAVDIGRPEAATWLSEHGAKYGLCQIYRNEPWHYELRTTAIDDGCPRPYADPTDDPRTQE
ncbi:M15 family metallopeptidase [Kribbella qitaiheensis]|uniref:M15 family metallopeptidase n=1 Tax=Kribbella qitaiheensis TaxID=1544730 RepID=A0A7G6X3J3_9ACTN|nr:M15 family metallopeptidase [Kribbella qitaiheensis]QNE20808.1 M15 family metallopeptidase [Kribbella qitaiheensis]